MAPRIRTVIYPVSNLAQAKAGFDTILRTAPVMDESYYVQFDADGRKIGPDPHGASKGMTDPVACWHVTDLHATVKQLLD